MIYYFTYVMFEQTGPPKNIRSRQGQIQELQKPNEVRTKEERGRHRGETEQEGRKRVMTTDKLRRSMTEAQAEINEQ